jgi:hypothetical protein
MAAQIPVAGYPGVSSSAPNYGLQIPDYTKKILFENPYGHPFLFLLEGTSRVTRNEKFQTLTSSLAQVEVAQTGTNSNSSAAITATYDSSYDAVFRKNGHFRVITTNAAGTTLNGQVLRCTANGSSGSVAMSIVGWTSGTYTFTASDYLVAIGSSFSEESSDVDEVSQQVTANYNYVTDHRTPFTVTDRARGTDYYTGMTEWAYQEKEAMRRHLLGKEMNLLFNKRYQTSSGNFSRTGTSGVIDLIQNVYSGTIAITKAQVTESYILGDVSKTCFATADASKSGSRRMWWMSSKAKSKIYQMMRDSIVPSDFSMPEYGIDIDKIKADFGNVDLMHHPLLDYMERQTASAEGIILSLDMDNIWLRHMEKDGVSLKDTVDTNIQDNAATVRTDRFRSVFGLHMELGSNHKVITISA